VTNKTPWGAKKHCGSIEQESHQTAKMFFRLAGSKLRDSIKTGFAQNTIPLRVRSELANYLDAN